MIFTQDLRSGVISEPSTLDRKTLPSTLNPQSCTLNSKPEPLNPLLPDTLAPQFLTLNPKP